jgi:ketosteroid isomerase-like protein
MGGATEAGPLAAVEQFVEAFNNDDVERMQAACTDETTIVDDVAPHLWSGLGATTTWYRGMAGMAGGYGMSDWSVTLDATPEVTVTGHQAYVVHPSHVRWTQDGRPIERPGFMTMALGEHADGWRIAALAWTWT